MLKLLNIRKGQVLRFLSPDSAGNVAVLSGFDRPSSPSDAPSAYSAAAEAVQIRITVVVGVCLGKVVDCKTGRSVCQTVTVLPARNIHAPSEEPRSCTKLSSLPYQAFLFFLSLPKYRLSDAFLLLYLIISSNLEHISLV